MTLPAKIDFIVGFEDYSWEFRSCEVPAEIARLDNDRIVEWFNDRYKSEDEPFMFVMVYWRDPSIDFVSGQSKLN